jgi:hypothetical protein
MSALLMASASKIILVWTSIMLISRLLYKMFKDMPRLEWRYSSQKRMSDAHNLVTAIILMSGLKKLFNNKQICI